MGWLWEVGAGNGEGVEDEPGAAGVEVVGGKALEDEAKRGLYRGAVFGQRKLEGGAAAAALLRVLRGATGGVVVVAEGLAAQADAAAAVAVGEDMAALVLRLTVVGCWLLVYFVHFDLSPHLGVFCAKYSKVGR